MTRRSARLAGQELAAPLDGEKNTLRHGGFYIYLLKACMSGILWCTSSAHGRDGTSHGTWGLQAESSAWQPCKVWPSSLSASGLRASCLTCRAPCCASCPQQWSDHAHGAVLARQHVCLYTWIQEYLHELACM